MSKNKKILYWLIGISLMMVLIIIRVYFLPGETNEGETAFPVFETRKTDGNPLKSTHPEDSDKTPVLHLPPKVESVPAAPTKIDELKQADDLDMNLVDGSMREYIHSLYFKFRNAKDREEFLANIKAELLKEFPVKTAEKILKMYEAYIDCELSLQEQMVSFEPPENEEDMLYMANEIYEFRKTHLGEELAEKLFGQEYKMTTYKILIGKIYKDDTLYGREKESRLRQAAAEVFGEDAADANIYDKTGESLFQEKLLIYKKDLDEMNEDAKKEKIREFRSEYLPPEDMEKIEAAEAQVEAVAKRDQDYTESKNAILNDAGLDDTEKQEKIRALQDAVYGDMADEIRRGEEFAAEHNEKMEKALNGLPLPPNPYKSIE
jgi:lipase chaperone LimK